MSYFIQEKIRLKKQREKKIKNKNQTAKKQQKPKTRQQVLRNTILNKNERRTRCIE